MIKHPILAIISLIFFAVVSYLEIRYYRAGTPKTKKWLVTLFVGGAGAAVSGGLSLIPEPIMMFQSIGTCGVMLFAVISGGIVGIYTVPRAMREAEKNRERLRGR